MPKTFQVPLLLPALVGQPGVLATRKSTQAFLDGKRSTEPKAGKIDKAEQASQGRSPRPSRVGVSRSRVEVESLLDFVFILFTRFL